MNIQATLTKREDEVAELLAWGAASKYVAHKLYISEDTVVNHRRNIFQKIGAHSIGQLCAWWFCKRFNISMKLNPLPVIALFFILLCVTDECVKKMEKQPIALRAKVRKAKNKTDNDLV